MSQLILLAQAEAGNPVTQIARTFGVDWAHLIAQTISFCIVCVLLYFFAYKRVLTMLEERRQRHAANYKVLVANDLSHWAERFMAVLERPPHAGNDWTQVRAAAGG